ncbi:hypothetical protein B0T11DRAFT_354198 [Plectosphaerella cucumerina]|uniref:Uncharacterized protein n=1 Tax=Plectosphaerella cucumerina TaxID=40658 RepID=A0A8K0T7F9_9PEZI|nr:hypothetical protein B0T11DRAFT_354198 [Plectosphaerella cucumerina]
MTPSPYGHKAVSVVTHVSRPEIRPGGDSWSSTRRTSPYASVEEIAEKTQSRKFSFPWSLKKASSECTLAGEQQGWRPPSHFRSRHDSLFLKYPYDFMAFVPFRAARRRHWATFLAGTTMILIFWLITPLQSAIIGTGVPYPAFAKPDYILLPFAGLNSSPVADVSTNWTGITTNLNH